MGRISNWARAFHTNRRELGNYAASYAFAGTYFCFGVFVLASADVSLTLAAGAAICTGLLGALTADELIPIESGSAQSV